MSQFALKLIAMFTMLLDHTAKVALKDGILAPVLGMELDFLLRTFMMVAGRISFPIFAWFTAEGCKKSSHPKRYLLRLLLFAVLAEIPFQLCFCNELGLGCKNVIFTLLLAATGIYSAKALIKYHVPEQLSQVLTGTAAIALGWLLHTDYNAWGVGLVLVLYYMPTEKGRLLFLSAWITVFQLIWHGWNGQTFGWLSPAGSIELLNWLGAMLAVGFLAAYNGEKGQGSKWLFYWFYPIHLLLLYIVSTAI